MTAADYIRGLLPRWARGTEVGRLVEALSLGSDTAREAVFTLRRLWVLATSSGAALDEHGAARSAPRWDNEPDESYRPRLLGLFEARLRQSTLPGMEALMASLGQPAARVRELYLDHTQLLFDGTWTFDGRNTYASPNRWAEFAIYLPWGAVEFAAATFERWEREVNRLKPAHTVLASFRLEVTDGDTWQGQFSEVLSGSVTTQERYDGTWTFSGDAVFGPVVEVLDA